MPKPKAESTPKPAAKPAGGARGLGAANERVRFLPAMHAAIAKLKEAREAAGLTLTELSKRSGITIETLSRLETGAAMNPTWKTLGDYAHAIGCRLTLGVEGVSED